MYVDYYKYLLRLTLKFSWKLNNYNLSANTNRHFVPPLSFYKGQTVFHAFTWQQSMRKYSQINTLVSKYSILFFYLVESSLHFWQFYQMSAQNIITGFSLQIVIIGSTHGGKGQWAAPDKKLFSSAVYRKVELTSKWMKNILPTHKKGKPLTWVTNSFIYRKFHDILSSLLDLTGTFELLMCTQRGSVKSVEWSQNQSVL